jgi:hypothetical protein
MTQSIGKSCELLITISNLISIDNERDFCEYAWTILGPLKLLEEQEDIPFNNDFVSMIASACLLSVGNIIRVSTSPRSLANAVRKFVLCTSKYFETDFIELALQEALEACLRHESTTLSEISKVTTELAKSRNWAAWAMVVKIKDGEAAEKSFIEIENVLMNPSTVDEKLDALCAIATLTQNMQSFPNSLAGRLLSTIGGEVLAIFLAYGTLGEYSEEVSSRRVLACANSLKISMASFKQYASDSSGSDVTGFLIILFETIIKVLRFNGLPNHPAPQGQLSNPSIGRMCAQAITHVAKTSPGSFKACMGIISEHERAVMELSVRAEMSGYVVAVAPAPIKKKLNVKGFTR